MNRGPPACRLLKDRDRARPTRLLKDSHRGQPGWLLLKASNQDRARLLLPRARGLLLPRPQAGLLLNLKNLPLGHMKKATMVRKTGS
ncbi:MAG: hypothetical protein M1438_15125 [Deltaproteobacteria bacterium]|nr:hypothetical protein [Deltaproteobacteria bacterium]